MLRKRIQLWIILTAPAGAEELVSIFERPVKNGDIIFKEELLVEEEAVEGNYDTATDTTDNVFAQDDEYIRRITEDILDPVRMEHERAKKKSSGNNEGNKIDADITMGDAVPDKLKIDEKFHDPYKHIHA